ncbi:Signal recognition particle 54 kDa protein, chloroplastic [Hordeum vulgare]|nr:Signal recognition particle 54 kDa protein, chloroplastic [Hordeum vulgare]
MKASSAPGPDGLPVVFFQRFWETVRPIIMPMFHEFFIGTLDMARINFGVIALIPKVVGASDIRQFRPITVINVLAQIFAKVRATQVGRKRRLFWLVFGAMIWTLWTTRNKMVIERVFQRHASDSLFKFLAFLQHWHPLARTQERNRLQCYLDALMTSARRLSARSHAA